jgi:hypothetical protein
MYTGEHYYLVVLCAVPKTFLAIDLVARMDRVSKHNRLCCQELHAHSIWDCALSDQAGGYTRAEREMCSFLSPQTGTFYDENFQSLKPHKSFLQLPHFIMRCTFIPARLHAASCNIVLMRARLPR